MAKIGGVLPLCCIAPAELAPGNRIRQQNAIANQSLRVERRSVLLGSGTLLASGVLQISNPAFADVKIALRNVEATRIPCPEGQTTVTGGTSFKATCFRVTGEATNPASQPVYNADIFGRVYDAQGEPALDTTENLRIDTLAEIPPGKSKVSFQITVSEEQAKLGPLELKNFKATGYLGKVNSKQGSGRLDDIDFSELDSD
ncbi:uncharacterized protein LOC9653685 [Selaginella moellendorffii]|uniref:uncharacterized protein LOC9653685 n=1 Tax=Selaginella moellendorffii TaxID=88036 RepID=UPI000D1C9169|nr:uncharacterized protein LOC9653685 [Selaginella moellendorffii]|eukprot:XP_024539220.1 uncharacterized protein LOC9653685 [Selaginella moellendorffii]